MLELSYQPLTPLSSLRGTGEAWFSRVGCRMQATRFNLRDAGLAPPRTGLESPGSIALSHLRCQSTSSALCASASCLKEDRAGIALRYQPVLLNHGENETIRCRASIARTIPLGDRGNEYRGHLWTLSSQQLRVFRSGQTRMGCLRSRRLGSRSRTSARAAESGRV